MRCVDRCYYEIAGDRDQDLLALVWHDARARWQAASMLSNVLTIGFR